MSHRPFAVISILAVSSLIATAGVLVGQSSNRLRACANCEPALRPGTLGRDSNGAPKGRMWLNCETCPQTQYTPKDLRKLGFGGNWMIRVTVEVQNCVPVELMGFDVG